ncbi:MULTISPECIES: VCBS repeat-containing protein [unclassified Yoonia]|uniref:beta strand repeat-containing protein n=1 Tax=unclassified Yoonia TaxID=2629118 RepID=UPI002AFE3445|nr:MULTISPECIES: VCBS repeat-containing protein [unclassified Yoonia]
MSLALFDDSDSTAVGTPLTRNIEIAAVNDAPIFTGLEPSVTYLENTVNAAGQLLDSEVSIGDPEGNFAGGTVTVSGLLAEDVIALANVGTGPGQIGFDATTAIVTFAGSAIGTLARATGTTTITLNATATPAAVEALVESLTYRNTSDTPAASRDLVITIADSDLATAAAPITVSVTAENDPPALINLAATTIFNENTVNAGPVPLIANAGGALPFGFIDPEGNAAGGSVTLSGFLHEDLVALPHQGNAAGQIGVVNGTVSFGGTAFAEMTGGGLAAAGLRAPLVFTFNSTATDAAIEALLERLTYANERDVPTTAARTITFDLVDGAGAERSFTTALQVNPENDAPTGNKLPTVVTILEDLNGRLDLSGLAIADPDITDKIDLVLTLTAGRLAAEPTSKVSVQSDDDGRKLTLTGKAADLGVYLADPDVVRLTGPADLTGIGVLTLTAIATDESSASVDLGSSKITLVAQPDAPIMTGLKASIVFSEAQANSSPAQSLGLAVTITDAEADFNGGRLTVSGLVSADRVAIANTADIAVAGTETQIVRFNGIEIGTAAGGAGADFVVTFNAAATLAGITAVVNALTYQQLTQAPVTSHPLFIALTDAAGNGLGDTSGIAFSFEAQADSPFDGIDFGVNADPAFVDLDGDGDLDLVVGLVGGTLVAYENTGSTFALMTINPFAGIDVGARSSPVFADVTGDGRADLVVGDNLGRFKVYQATANGFVQLTGAANPLDGLDIGSNAKPAFVDIDRDGDLDLVAGGADGRLHAFENIGGTFVAPVSWRDPFVQLSLTGSGKMTFATFDLTNLAKTEVTVTKSGISHTTLTDVTLVAPLRVVTQDAGTANWSLALNGDVFAYLAADESVTLTYQLKFTSKADTSVVRQFTIKVTGTTTDPLIELVSLGADVTGTVAQGLVPITVSNGANPDFADLDGDGDADLLIGDGNGGLRSFTNTGMGRGWLERVGSDNPFAALSVGSAAAPALVDLDQDGRPDVVVGGRDGTLALWRNTTPEGLSLQIDMTPENDKPSATGLPSDLVVRVTAQSSLDLRTLKLVDPDQTDLLDLVLVASTGRLTATAAPDVAVTGAGTATLVLRGTAAALNGYLADPVRVSFVNSEGRASGDNAARIDVTLNDGTGAIALGKIDLDIAPGNGTSHLSNLAATVAFTESTVNSAPQIIDPDVYFVSLAQSFAGGQLRVAGLLPEDRLAVRDGGTAAGQIGVKFNSVTAQQEITFDGKSIGILTGGVGTPLSVTFNDNASAAAIDRLLESLTYANSSDTPTPIRTLTLQITDSDGVGLTSAGAANTTFALVQGAASPLTGKTADKYAAPTIGDVTGDGRPDLVVGNNFGLLTVYAATDAGFSFMTPAASPFAGIDVGSYAAPVLTDLDGDGLVDMVVGTSTGKLVVLRATKTGYVMLTGSDNPFDGIDVGAHAAPAFADIDGDGDLDMVVGNTAGRLVAYANTGVMSTTTGLPVYRLLAGAQDPFAGIDVGSRSRPSFLDVDQDGDMDLFVANSVGVISGFVNTGTAFVAMSAQANPFTGLTGGRFSSLSFGYIDGDGKADAVVGDITGQMLLFANTTQTQQAAALVLTVTPENDLPTGLGLPANLTVTKQAAAVIDLSKLVLADPDSPTLALTLTVANGTLAAEDVAGIGITGSGTASLRLIGSVAALNDYLQEPALLRYTAAADATGSAADTLAVTINDGTDTVSIGVAAIDIAPLIPNNLPTGTVKITGTPAQDRTLFADTSTLGDADGLGTLLYSWKADGVIVPRGNNQNSLTLTEAEIGKVITLQVSYVDGAGTTETLASAPTAAIAANPAPTPPFRIALVSQEGGVAQFEIFATPAADPGSDGIGSFEFTLSHDPADLFINVNSFTTVPGAAGLPNYNAATGVLAVAGAALPNLTDFSMPLVRFSAKVLGGDKLVTLNLTETEVDAVSLATVTAEFALIAATGSDPTVSVTTTLLDRFGDPLSADTVSAMATVSGDQIHIRKSGAGADSTTFEIVVTPTTALSAIDFVLSDFTTLENFTLAPALADWVVLTYGGTPNSISLSGFGGISGGDAIAPGVETVLARFTTAAEPDLIITNIALNGIAQPAVGISEIAASVRTGNIVTFDAPLGADLRILADLAVDSDSKGAIGANDALQALRLAVGLPKSDGTAEWHDYIAADFNRDGRLGADDALNILKYAVGLAGAAEPEWVFVDAGIDRSGIDRNAVFYEQGLRRDDLLVDTGVSMIGILVGDVDGSYYAS